MDTAGARSPEVDPQSVIAAVIAVPSAAATTWFLVGDLSDTDPAGADYFYRQPTWFSAHELLIGVVSIVVLAAAVATLLVRWRQRETGTEWKFLAIMWGAAGIGIGFATRVVTAGVIGANIGGGLVLLAAPIGLLFLLGMSAWLIAASRQASPSSGVEVNRGDAG